MKNVAERPRVIPDEAKIYWFKDVRGRPVCWHPSTRSAEDFVLNSGVTESSAVFVPLPGRRSRTLNVYIPPIDDERGSYFMVKRFKDVHGWNMRKLLRDIETSLVMAVAYDLKRNFKQTHITSIDIHRQMRRIAICKFKIHLNNVYVDLNT